MVHRQASPRHYTSLAVVVVSLSLGIIGAGANPGEPPVVVKITQDKVAAADVVLPVDEKRVPAQPSFHGFAYGLNIDGKRLTFSEGSARTGVRIDNQNHFPNGQQQNLPPGPTGKPRRGVQTSWTHNNVVVTQIMEIVPGKPGGKVVAGQKRLLDTLLIRYVVENKDTRPHLVGVRVRMDTYCWTNDGCLFVLSTKPKEIQNGVEIKGKDVPPYAQILQNNDLRNPGWIAHFTFKIGRFEPPTRVIFTAHGIGDDGFNVPAQPANGDSDAAFIWDPVMIAPGGKREMAFAHGEGIASSPEDEGRVRLELGGSFEPGKVFTVTAHVEGAVHGQVLRLELPEGMELLEGREMQPVPAPGADGTSIVYWRARVQRLGGFPVRVRSSTGVTYTTRVAITRPKTP